MVLLHGQAMRCYQYVMASDQANLHSDEAMYVSVIDFQWYCVFNSLVIRHLIMITCISYEIIFTIYLPKLINIAPV